MHLSPLDNTSILPPLHRLNREPLPHPNSRNQQLLLPRSARMLALSHPLQHLPNNWHLPFPRKYHKCNLRCSPSKVR